MARYPEKTVKMNKKYDEKYNRGWRNILKGQKAGRLLSNENMMNTWSVFQFNFRSNSINSTELWRYDAMIIMKEFKLKDSKQNLLMKSQPIKNNQVTEDKNQVTDR